MFNSEDYVDELSNMEAPKDLSKSGVLTDTPVELRMLSQRDKKDLGVAAAIFKCQKNIKKPFSRIDLKASEQGYFDDAGNYVIGGPKKIFTAWILSRNGLQEGPFTEKEFEAIMNDEKNEGCLVKRDSDKGFVLLDDLREKVPSLNFRELNKFFAAHHQAKETRKEEEFFESTIFSEKSNRLTNFLRSQEVCASDDFIIKSIKGQKKYDAIETVRQITGLDKSLSSTLVDLIIEGADTQILSDVDKDGFCIACKKGVEKKERRK